MQHPGGLYMATSASSSAAPSVVGSAYSPANSIAHGQTQTAMRPHLPDRVVDVNTIEEAYVNFILACNPGVPMSADTTALREAFRTPPRSDGRNFSIYVLYLLICELEERIIKTWAELALKLGVEAPDQEKGQSSQKIQQYAVRLKRWMHSMHVDAFFDYLMGRPHPYWTDIPPEHYPISELLRDGVAAKDDMALRALIPEIKPRRGRKRDDENESSYMGGRDAQRQRLDPYGNEWTGDQNAGGMFGYASHQQPSPTDGTMRSSPPWAPMAHGGFWSDEQKPAVNSSGRRPGRRHGAKVVSSAWRSNGNGGSGKTRGRPPINRAANHNHHRHPPSQGSSSPPGPGVERTTPPYLPQSTSSYLPHMQPTASISPLPHTTMATLADHNAVAAMSNVGHHPSGIMSSPVAHSNYSAASDSPPIMAQPIGHASGLAHHVPEQKVADGHLTPPSMHSMHGAAMSGGPEMGMHVPGMSHAINPSVANITLNSYGASQLGLPPNMHFSPVELSHSPHAAHHHMGGTQSPMYGIQDTTTSAGTHSVTSDAVPSYTPEPMIDSTHKPGEGKNAYRGPAKLPMYQTRFGTGSPNDRTNIDELEAFFMTEMFAATWYDEHDKKIPPCSVEEATALVEIIINDLTKAAASKEAFLINLAALAGGKMLMAHTEVRVKRLETTAEHNKYEISWELRYGDVRRQFSIQEAVPHARWKKITNEVKASVARAVGLGGDASSTASQQGQGPSARSHVGDDKATFPINSAYMTRPGGVDHHPAASATSSASGPGGSRPQSSGQPTAPTSQPITFGLPSTGVGVGAGAATGSTSNVSDDNAALAALWERKYRHVLHLLYKRDQQLDRTRSAVLRGLQETYQDDDSLDI